VLEEVEELSNPKVRSGKKALTPEQLQAKSQILNVMDAVRDESGREAAVRLVFEPKTSRIEQALQRFRAYQRRIAIKNQHQLGLGNLIQRHAHRVPGAALLGLGNPAQLRPGGGNAGAQLLALMAVNHRAFRRREHLQRLHQMHNHRLAADRLQNLGLGGVHTFALTGSENEGERLHVDSLWMTCE